MMGLLTGRSPGTLLRAEWKLDMNHLRGTCWVELSRVNACKAAHQAVDAYGERSRPGRNSLGRSAWVVARYKKGPAPEVQGGLQEPRPGFVAGVRGVPVGGESGL